MSKISYHIFTVRDGRRKVKRDCAVRAILFNKKSAGGYAGYKETQLIYPTREFQIIKN